MRIAFDLDGTVVPVHPGQFPSRFLPWPWRLYFEESIRDGAPELMEQLSRQGHEVWIYTTSLRPRWYVWALFRIAGVKLAGVVNAETSVSIRGVPLSVDASKFPPAFGIDLLIDDSQGVAFEAARHGFKVVIIEPEDRDWAIRVLSATNTLKL